MRSTAKLLVLLKTGYQRILKDNLVGIYLHGSFVLGSFSEAISDLDYLVVTYKSLSLVEKEKLMKYTIDNLWSMAPAKGLEFHVVLLENTLNFNEPVPFELHFSKQYYEAYLDDPKGYVNKMHGSDPDLTAHLMIVTKVGKVLIGKSIKKVFCQIPSSAYWNSILYDISNAKSMIVEHPMYTTLNLCRALVYKKESVIDSKLSGGQWGLKKLPARYRKIVKKALVEYTSSGMTKKCKEKYDELVLIEFAEYMLNKINE